MDIELEEIEAEGPWREDVSTGLWRHPNLAFGWPHLDAIRLECEAMDGDEVAIYLLDGGVGRCPER